MTYRPAAGELCCRLQPDEVAYPVRAARRWQRFPEPHGNMTIANGSQASLATRHANGLARGERSLDFFLLEIGFFQANRMTFGGKSVFRKAPSESSAPACCPSIQTSAPGVPALDFERSGDDHRLQSRTGANYGRAFLQLNRPGFILIAGFRHLDGQVPDGSSKAGGNAVHPPRFSALNRHVRIRHAGLDRRVAVATSLESRIFKAGALLISTASGFTLEPSAITSSESDLRSLNSRPSGGMGCGRLIGQARLQRRVARPDSRIRAEVTDDQRVRLAALQRRGKNHGLAGFPMERCAKNTPDPTA